MDEIPQSRINIRLDLNHGHATVRHELPLKCLVLGAFTNPDHPLKQRDRYQVNKVNFNQVLARLAPNLELTIGGETNAFKFNHLNDFTEVHIAKQMPRCQRLLAMRNLLKDLQSQAFDNRDFLHHLQDLIRDPKQFRELSQQIAHLIKDEPCS